jgi:hypothetical protein
MAQFVPPFNQRGVRGDFADLQSPQEYLESLQARCLKTLFFYGMYAPPLTLINWPVM